MQIEARIGTLPWLRYPPQPSPADSDLSKRDREINANVYELCSFVMTSMRTCCSPSGTLSLNLPSSPNMELWICEMVAVFTSNHNHAIASLKAPALLKYVPLTVTCGTPRMVSSSGFEPSPIETCIGMNTSFMSSNCWLHLLIGFSRCNRHRATTLRQTLQRSAICIAPNLVCNPNVIKKLIKLIAISVPASSPLELGRLALRV